ncbi:MAG: TonB-dependent receptor, partial [Ferruginibacter sp.]
RYSLFNYMGKGKAYFYDADGNKTGEKLYAAGESIKFYGGLEPRFSARLLLNETSSFKVSFNTNYQFLHLLTNATTSSPTDLWIPSSNNVKPQVAHQLSAGYFKNFKDNTYEFSAETYYKKLQNVVDYRNGAQLILNDEVESELLYGKGKAYGLELFLKKNKGKFTGWAGYTLSRTLRSVPGINNGNDYPARQDRIHDISLVGMYRLSEKLTFAANWVFNTGDAATFPAGNYIINGLSVPYYTDRNAYRYPSYHRMDVGVTWYRKKKKRLESSWNFSIYNVYSRENAYAISFRQNEDDPTKNEAVQTTLFKIVPSITYNFKF